VEKKIDIDQIKIVATSRSYPGWMYAYSPRLPQEAADKIKAALLQLDYGGNAHHRTILEAARFIGFVSSDDRDFDPIRELNKKVGLPLE